MRVLVTGDRYWTDDAIVNRVLSELYERTEDLLVIQGGAKGADRIARTWALTAKLDGLKVEHRQFDAEWSRKLENGATFMDRGAGPRRNQQMLDEGDPELVIAFHDDLEGKSKGTKDMVERARAAQVRTILVSHADPELPDLS